MAINSKVGDRVYMFAFTGMLLGKFEVSDAGKKSITITQKNGRVTKFDRETGKQLDAKTPRCASRIADELTSAERKQHAEKLVKLGEVVEAETPAKSKKAAKATKTEKAAPVADEKPTEEVKPDKKARKEAAAAKRKAKEDVPANEDEYEDA